MLTDEMRLNHECPLRSRLWLIQITTQYLGDLSDRFGTTWTHFDLLGPIWINQAFLFQ